MRLGRELRPHAKPTADEAFVCCHVTFTRRRGVDAEFPFRSPFASIFILNFYLPRLHSMIYGF